MMVNLLVVSRCCMCFSFLFCVPYSLRDMHWHSVWRQILGHTSSDTWWHMNNMIHMMLTRAGWRPHKRAISYDLCGYQGWSVWKLDFIWTLFEHTVQSDLGLLTAYLFPCLCQTIILQLKFVHRFMYIHIYLFLIYVYIADINKSS